MYFKRRPRAPFDFGPEIDLKFVYDPVGAERKKVNFDKRIQDVEEINDYS